MIKLLVDNKEVKFETTIFPDGTSQVWKVGSFESNNKNDVVIFWSFESESEVMHILQLASLVKSMTGVAKLSLHAPYLPYARQDKYVGNDASFALDTFLRTMFTNDIQYVECFDPHSVSHQSYKALVNVSRPSPYPTVEEFHNSILNHDVICYPDKGAAARYGTYGKPVVHCEKVRNQRTGEILGLKLIGDVDLTGKKILIIDDICDGGMTFIKVAQLLQPHKPLWIDLAVSHGLFSKGKDVLHEAGIMNIYTTNSLLRNPYGFKVC